MSKVTITTDMIQNANTYIPLVERQELIEQIARECVVKVRMSFVPTGETEKKPLPDRFQENRIATCQFLMGVLAIKYLKQQTDWDKESLKMPANIYDDWAGSHVLRQIEGMRSDKTVQTQAADILQDFRDFRSSLYQEINVLLAHNNDIVWRLLDALNGMTAGEMTDTMKDEAQQDAERTMAEKLQKRRDDLQKAIDDLKGMQDRIAGMMQEAEGKIKNE